MRRRTLLALAVLAPVAPGVALADPLAPYREVRAGRDRGTFRQHLYANGRRVATAKAYNPGAGWYEHYVTYADNPRRIQAYRWFGGRACGGSVAALVVRRVYGAFEVRDADSEGLIYRSTAPSGPSFYVAYRPEDYHTHIYGDAGGRNHVCKRLAPDAVSWAVGQRADGAWVVVRPADAMAAALGGGGVVPGVPC